jgi:hypothetical protein
MRDMGENAREAAEQARVSADEAREAARQIAHDLAAAQAETARQSGWARTLCARSASSA